MQRRGLNLNRCFNRENGFVTLAQHWIDLVWFDNLSKGDFHKDVGPKNSPHIILKFTAK